MVTATDPRPTGADPLERPPRRAVVLVGNPAAPYSRSLRIARALVRAGYTVEIAAIAAPGLPDRELGEGWTVRRYRPSGAWARLGGSAGTPSKGPVSTPSPGPAVGRERPLEPIRRAGRRAVGLGLSIRRWLFWPHTVRGWWATLERELEPADLYHACGSLTVAAALSARRRSPTGPAGRSARVIYDAIDDVFESNNVLDMPGPIRAWHARRETAWALGADALITVNEPLAERLGERWGRRPVSVPNYPEIGPSTLAGGSAGDPIRRETGIGAGTRVILFEGRLGPRLGLDEAAEATLLVPDAALVLVGFGRGFEAEQARDAVPRFAGRHFTLPARHPDELVAWTASADVAIVPLPPVSVNQRLSSPNKFWEAVSAGLPVVVSEGLSYMAGLVRDADLGVVARSGSAVDLAAAIVTALERSGSDPTWRERIRTTAEERYAWSAAVEAYLAVVRSIAPD